MACCQLQPTGDGDGWARHGRLEAQLAEPLPPADSNVGAFDRIGERRRPIADIIRDTTRDHQAGIARHVIESVVVKDGEVVDVLPRPEARPLHVRAVVAPPDGRLALTAKPEASLGLGLLMMVGAVVLVPPTWRLDDSLDMFLKSPAAAASSANAARSLSARTHRGLLVTGATYAVGMWAPTSSHTMLGGTALRQQDRPPGAHEPRGSRQPKAEEERT